MSAQDERTWSVLAHLSMFLNLVTGFLGPVAARPLPPEYLVQPGVALGIGSKALSLAGGIREPRSPPPCIAMADTRKRRVRQGILVAGMIYI